ncbi:MAG TPA: Hsp33 family molecular chaperone HslO, partial [Clostridiales bacterium]|nr:Hsp33 family molecular chaperone HslO [Clostridiales bacterium]
MDRIVNAISGDGMVRIRVLEGKNMVEEARRIHNTTPTTTALLGRVIMAASLMGSDMKNEKDSLTLRINGNGPAGQVLAVADSGGFVRGYVQRPAIDLPLNSQGKLDVGGAVMGKPEDNLENKGTLTVIKDLGLKEPYVGQIDLVSGEIGDDVTAYLFQSEQIPSVCGLGVLVDTDCSVKVA